MTTFSTYAVRKTQRQNAELMHVAKSAIWRFNFSTQPTNRRFGDPEGSKAAQFSPTLAWTYVPCCPQAYFFSTFLLRQCRNYFRELIRLGYTF